jgi:raffinose/stachyose/melibiose transport system substrate-binding protein
VSKVTLPTDLKEDIMKRLLAMCMVLVLMLTVFSGCGKKVETTSSEKATETVNEETKEKDKEESKDEVKEEVKEEAGLTGEIEFMTGTSIDSALFIAYEEITQRFMEENPEVTVELLPSSTDHEGEVKTRLASDNAPDIWMTHGWSVGRYGEFLEPLNDRPWAKDLNPALNSVMLDKEGTLYAFPIDLDIAGILYNSKVLESVGVKSEDIKTWDDFYAVCDKVLEKGIVPIYTAGKDRWPTGLFIDWIGPGAFTQGRLRRTS